MQIFLKDITLPMFKKVLKEKYCFLIFLIFLPIIFFNFPGEIFALTREELEEELKKIELQIKEYERELFKTQTQKQNLINTINQLKKEQEKISLQIRSTNLQIKELDKEIAFTEKLIKNLLEKINTLKNDVSGVIRVMYARDKISLVEVFLTSNSFSSFVSKSEALKQLSQKLNLVLKEVKKTKEELEQKRQELESKQNDKKNLLAIQILQSQSLQFKTAQQNQILKETQGKEAKYQASIANSKKRAQEIRSRIYELLGVSNQITFGEAVEIAKWAESLTGVRAALLLAVLTQESNLGKNVGTCNRPGDPPSKSWKVVMKPDRDQSLFLAILNELKMNPDVTPISCPMRDAKGNQIGWGGAMGPAQFIPSTWVLYKDKISALTGKKPANPWNIKDAFLGAALLLKDNGAIAGNQDAEWAAAMRYFSGSTNPRFRFYGDNVMAIAKKYEQDIKDIS